MERTWRPPDHEINLNGQLKLEARTLANTGIERLQFSALSRPLSKTPSSCSLHRSSTAISVPSFSGINAGTSPLTVYSTLHPPFHAAGRVISHPNISPGMFPDLFIGSLFLSQQTADQLRPHALKTGLLHDERSPPELSPNLPPRSNYMTREIFRAGRHLIVQRGVSNA